MERAIDWARRAALMPNGRWLWVSWLRRGAFPIAARLFPVLVRLADYELRETGERHYRVAANLLVRARGFVVAAGQGDDFDAIVRELAPGSSPSSGLQQEFDRAGLAR
ncbi:hypothetical protein [Luteococcus sanguinis]|uniref:Uncharacterized protein n=1 Tax=Luteococcus sanguinis TaxID=174038 RepID=A0ABW1X4V9_9ACTN